LDSRNNIVRKGRLTRLLAVRDVLDHIEDRFHDGSLEVVSTLIPQDARQEREHDSLFCREFQTKRPDCVHHDDLEFVRDLAHEAGDLLHKTIDGGFVSSLHMKDGSVSGRHIECNLFMLTFSSVVMA